MKRNVTKASKITLCRAYHGTGIVLKTMEHPPRLFVRKRQEITEGACSQRGGSGRVTVSAGIELDIRPYKPKGQEEQRIARRRGVSYKKRVEEINRMYDREVRRGIPNREMWHRFIHPVHGITERTFYNILSTSADERDRMADGDDIRQPLPFKDEDYE